MTMGACLTSIQAKMKVGSEKIDVETEYPIQEGTIVKEALRRLRTTQPRMVSENLPIEETSDDPPVVVKIEEEEMEAERDSISYTDMDTDSVSEVPVPSSSKNPKRMSSNLYSDVKAPAIGIDLGTTYSTVAVFQNGKVEIIADNGNQKTPNFVAFTDTQRLIGEEAKKQRFRNPLNTIFDVHRLIGRKFEDSSVQYDMNHWPFVVVNDGGKPKVQVEFRGERKILAPEEITAMILTKMKEIAEAYLGKTVTDAVITVPVYFNYDQKEGIKVAARIAGLKVLGLLAASTAAAIAYATEKHCVKK